MSGGHNCDFVLNCGYDWRLILPECCIFQMELSAVAWIIATLSLSLWVKVNGGLLLSFIGGLQKQVDIELGCGWWVRRRDWNYPEGV